MAVSETDQSQVCLKVEDLQSDPGQGDVGQKERTSVVEMYIDDCPDWTSLSCLTPDCEGIDYKQIIEKERLPAASPFTNVYAGALYAKLAGDEYRCVYFEPQPDTTTSVMRVAKNVEGNDTVKHSYPWDRVNFVYKVEEATEREVGERTYKCYIYTPANLDSYGLAVERKNVHFEPTTSQGFTSVQITQKDPSRDNKANFRLYVDEEDGWKVKASRKCWTTFVIKPFSLQYPSENVKWHPVSSLKLHHQFIKERMPALFQNGSGDNVFAGALHIDMDCAQIAYFESAEPRKPRMRVAKTKEVSHSSWDRINLVYYQVAAESSEYTFQIFTPANHGTYGLKATEEELIFEKLPEGEKHEEYFTHFQIKRGESTNPITTTTRHTTLGVYVDTKDGWKVKLTEEEEHWDKFRIAGFTPKTTTLSSPKTTAAVKASRGVHRKFSGAMYAHSARGKPFSRQNEARIVYFESANPDEPRMRVATTSEAEEKVLQYSWDRINFVYSYVTHTPGDSEYSFQICTPAIRGTYGLQAKTIRGATEEELIFKKLPGDDNSDDYFTEFQITTGENISPITTTTNRNSPFGMYVDRNDEWKVKLTNDRKLWDKFTIGGKKAYQ